MNLQEPLKNELKIKPTWNENMSPRAPHSVGATGGGKKEVIKQGEVSTENKTKQMNKSSNNKAKQTNKSAVVNENAAKQTNKSAVVNTKKSVVNRPILRKLKKVKLGDMCVLKISALGPKGIGIDEYSYSNSIFIRNTNLGETVKAKIIKNNQLGPPRGALEKGNKYSIARVLEVIKKPMADVKKVVTIQPDEVLTVNIEKLTSKGAGIVNLKNDYKLIIPNANIGKDIQVVVTRVKSKYGFAKVFQDSVKVGSKTNKWKPDNKKLSGASLLEGSKYTLTLPKVGKYFGKYAIVKLNNSIVFIKLNLRAKPGNKVRIKITKMNSQFALAKIVQINPISLLKKRILVQNSIRQMVKNGMHLGEKVVKCNARMKKYVWLKKQGGGGFPPAPLSGGKNQNRPLIQKGRHIINLLKTRRCLNKALTQLSKYAVKGRTFLFIGTKKPAASLIARASLFSKTSFFVNTRWLGGMLTNWKTILKSISKIRPILKEKQKILADILEQRQSLKNHLMKKALFLKTKSQLILNKGRFLIARLKNPTSKLEILEKTKKLSLIKKQLIENCHSLLSKRQTLIAKRKDLMHQSLFLKEKGIQVVSRYKTLLRELTIHSKKLRELQYLLILSNEIKNIKNKASNENKKMVPISFGKIKELTRNSNYNLIPEPPREILTLMLLTLKNIFESDSFKLGPPIGGEAPPLWGGALEKDELQKIEAKNETKIKGLILHKLLIQFITYTPNLKELISTYEQNIKQIETSLQNCSNVLNKIKTTLRQSIEFKNNVVKELNSIKSKLILERNIIRILKTKFKHFTAQKRLIKLLPRLRYLSKPLFTTKMIQTVKILMKKIVDPKLKYPVDNIYDDKLSNNSKKVAAARKKKWQRLEKYFGGVSKMTKMSKSEISKNVAIVIGQKEEISAVRECQKLGIKMFNIVDTNCNPSLADHIIPANDDSRNSIKYVLNKFLVRIRLAQKLRQKISPKLRKIKNVKKAGRTLKANKSQKNKMMRRP